LVTIPEEVLQRTLNREELLQKAKEVGELAEGLAKDHPGEVMDGIGDIYVVLTVLSLQLGISIKDCIADAYFEIFDRKGKTINGVYVKEEDL